MAKTALITGASQGLGLALSGYFSRRGYFVYAASHPVLPELSGPGRAFRTDISSEAEVRRMFHEIDRLDVLINNARFDPSGRKDDTSDSDWWDMNVDVSLKGTFLCSVAGLERMKENEEGGAIVNISSIRAVIPNDWNRIPYGAAKAGQINLTRSFAKIGAPFNIRVNALLPGVIDTENLRARADAGRLDAVRREIPLQRFGSMEEICHAAMFLVENTYTTGACLNCSGGLLMDA